MPRVRAPTAVKLRLDLKMTRPMISSWTIMGVPRMTVTYTLAHGVGHAQGGIADAGALLVVGGADHGHQHAQGDADGQGQGGGHQGGAHAAEILLPAVRLQKSLVELDEKLLPPGQVRAAGIMGFHSS